MRRDNALLKDILDAINAVEAFVGGKDKKSFLEATYYKVRLCES